MKEGVCTAQPKTAQKARPCPRFKPGLQRTGVLALAPRVTAKRSRAALPPRVAPGKYHLYIRWTTEMKPSSDTTVCLHCVEAHHGKYLSMLIMPNFSSCPEECRRESVPKCWYLASSPLFYQTPKDATFNLIICLLLKQIIFYLTAVK